DLHQDGQQRRQGDRAEDRGVPGGGGQRRLGEFAGLLRDPDQSAGRRQLADHRRQLHPDLQAAGRPGSGQDRPAVLRLGLCERRQAGRGARLCADPGQGRRAGQEHLEEERRGRQRQGYLLSASELELLPGWMGRAAAHPSQSNGPPMTQIAIKDAAVLDSYAVHGRRQRAQDQLFRAATLFFALLVLALLGGVILALIVGAWPSLSTYGFSFLYTEVWNPVTEKFGGLAPIYGTLVTSALAMLFGVPVSFGIAMFITELCPPWLKR